MVGSRALEENHGHHRAQRHYYNVGLQLLLYLVWSITGGSGRTISCETAANPDTGNGITVFVK